MDMHTGWMRMSIGLVLEGPRSVVGDSRKRCGRVRIRGDYSVVSKCSEESDVIQTHLAARYSLRLVPDSVEGASYPHPSCPYSAPRHAVRIYLKIYTEYTRVK
jgi:hypothetical protein